VQFLDLASLPLPRKVSGMHPKRLNTVDDGVQAIHIGRFWDVAICMAIISCMHIFFRLRCGKH